MPAAPDSAAPVSAKEAEELFGELEEYSRIALGVSGGPDSLALLHLIALWSRARSSLPLPIVLTVDHGLRREAAAEAEYVEAVCRRYAVPHEILRWREPKPGAGIQARARAARMELMSAAARKAGSQAIVLAHHMDDQAETFLQRLQRGSGVYGLAAMRKYDEWHGIPVFRPFLGIPKSRLIATLEAAGLAWCEDPTNEDAAFSRVRWRKLMPRLAQEGLTASRLAGTAQRMARAAEALDAWVDDILLKAEVHPAGPVRIAIDALARLPAEIRYRTLARLVRFCAGSAYVPRLDKLERAADDLLTAAAHRRTLGGAVLSRHRDQLFVWREAGRSGLPAIRLDGMRETVWDGRFRFHNRRQDLVVVSPLGAGGLKKAGLVKPESWPEAAFHCAPMLSAAIGEIFVPGISKGPGLQGCEVSLLQSFLASAAGEEDATA